MTLCAYTTAGTPMPTIEDALRIAATEHDVHKVSEDIGPNDSLHIRMYLAAVGITKPAPWCAAFLAYCLLEAGFARKAMAPHPASTCAWLQWAKANGWLDQGPARAVRGDAFVWCNATTWAGHIGWILEARKIAGVWWVRTLEGNSNEGGSREGTKIVRRGRQGIPAPIGWRLWTPKMRLIRLTVWAEGQL